MKRMISVLMIIVVLLSSSGCRPAGMSKKACDLGIKALNAGGSYSELNEITDQLAELYDAEKMSSPDTTTSTLILETMVSAIAFDTQMSDKASYDKNMEKLKEFLGK